MDDDLRAELEKLIAWCRRAQVAVEWQNMPTAQMVAAQVGDEITAILARHPEPAARRSGKGMEHFALPEEPEPAAPSEREKRLEDELRSEWWGNHGCCPTARYGDDGEMQCGSCLTDFKWMPIDELERKVESLRAEKMRAALSGEQAKEA
jgi:hypothetical protein